MLDGSDLRLMGKHGRVREAQQFVGNETSALISSRNLFEVEFFVPCTSCNRRRQDIFEWNPASPDDDGSGEKVTLEKIESNAPRPLEFLQRFTFRRVCGGPGCGTSRLNAAVRARGREQIDLQKVRVPDERLEFRMMHKIVQRDGVAALAQPGAGGDHSVGLYRFQNLDYRVSLGRIEKAPPRSILRSKL